MEFRQLANFIRIVDAGSMTRAAAHVGIAQPALTQQIASLEEELGCQLLIRSTRGVHPTEAGMIFYREAQSIVRQMQRLPQQLKMEAEEPAGQVIIGFPSSLAPYFSAGLIKAVHERLPRIRLQIFEKESVLLRELITQNRVELALLCEHVPSGDIHHRPLFDQRLAFISDGTDANDAGNTPISLAEAAGRVAALPSVGNPVRAAFDAAVDKYDMRTDIRFELNSVRTLTGAVSEGLGAAVNLWIPQSDGHALHFRPIVEPELLVRVSLCRSRTVDLTPAARLIEGLIIQVVLARIAQPDWMGALVTHSDSP